MIGTVEIGSAHRLADGSTAVKKGLAHIDRDSRGRIYNERRIIAAANDQGMTAILSSPIQDPQTRMSVLLDPSTQIARQTTLSARPTVLIRGQIQGRAGAIHESRGRISGQN
jgi:hypothetical protein